MLSLVGIVGTTGDQHIGAIIRREADELTPLDALDTTRRLDSIPAAPVMPAGVDHIGSVRVPASVMPSNSPPLGNDVPLAPVMPSATPPQASHGSTSRPEKQSLLSIRVRYVGVCMLL
jgi:hypothetical protein